MDCEGVGDEISLIPSAIYLCSLYFQQGQSGNTDHDVYEMCNTLQIPL